jgi:Protein of unknown function (DUF1553)/Protein of unknown function (DUF1549)
MRPSLFLAAVVVGLAQTASAQDRVPAPEEIRFFELRVRPLLADLSPTPQLSPQQWRDLARWVRMGAPTPKKVALSKEDAAKHWAFLPMKSTAVPRVKNEGWARTPIDQFVLTQLEAKGLKPSPPADPCTLIRRVTFDLTGLPPTPEEVERFVRDASAKPDAAYEALIDRLLASSAYGEKWGRHWLDVARYADSNGLDENIAHGNAWRYRDYVIAAFNNDKPYNQFLMEQVAGDLLASPQPSGSPQRKQGKDFGQLIATGFLSLGPKVLAEPDEKKMEMDIVDEQIDTFGRALMGLTLGCARCHDHKFDPLPQDDYYGLAGIFQSTRTMEHFKKIAKWYENPIAAEKEVAAKAEHDKQIEKLKTEIKSAKADEKKPLMEKLAALEKNAPQVASAMGVTEGSAVNAPVLVRGNHVTPGNIVPRRFPVILAGTNQPTLPEKQSGRLELAQWLASKDHPLTARVIVNRVWRWHFGQGIVRSVDNFGRLGEKPSHPELLDWLALKFIEDGWSIKKLHRTILQSSTYRQSSTLDPKAAEVDPENKLLWRCNPRRLQSEEIRDALLFVSGQLDRTMGGPAITHVKNREFLFDHTSKDGTKYDSKRRTIYLPVIRNNLYEVFTLFDSPDAAVSTGDRATTTVATQALFWMNSPLVLEAAANLPRVGLHPKDTTQVHLRLRLLYLNAYGREPTENEAARMSNAYAETKVALRQKGDTADLRERAWAMIAHVILSGNEFVWIR